MVSLANQMSVKVEISKSGSPKSSVFVGYVHMLHISSSLRSLAGPTFRR